MRSRREVAFFLGRCGVSPSPAAWRLSRDLASVSGQRPWMSIAGSSFGDAGKMSRSSWTRTSSLTFKPNDSRRSTSGSTTNTASPPLQSPIQRTPSRSLGETGTQLFSPPARRSTCWTTPTDGRPRSRWDGTSPSTGTSGLTRPSDTARRRSSTRRADATKAFAINFPLRRTQNERTPTGTQPEHSLVAARDPLSGSRGPPPRNATP